MLWPIEYPSSQANQMKAKHFTSTGTGCMATSRKVRIPSFWFSGDHPRMRYQPSSSLAASRWLFLQSTSSWWSFWLCRRANTPSHASALTETHPSFPGWSLMVCKGMHFIARLPSPLHTCHSPWPLERMWAKHSENHNSFQTFRSMSKCFPSRGQFLTQCSESGLLRSTVFSSGWMQLPIINLDLNY